MRAHTPGKDFMMKTMSFLNFLHFFGRPFFYKTGLFQSALLKMILKKESVSAISVV